MLKHKKKRKNQKTRDRQTNKLYWHSRCFTNLPVIKKYKYQDMANRQVTDRQSDRHAHRQVDREADSWTKRQKDRQLGRHTHRQMDRETV